MEPHLSPQGTIKAHSSQPLGPLHKPDPPLVVFLCMYLGDSQVAHCQRAIILHEETREINCCWDWPQQVFCGLPKPPGCTMLSPVEQKKK